MMRGFVTLALLGSAFLLTACAENTGWNPNYSAMGNGSDYATYLQQREIALHGKGAVPQVIPVQLPAKAPTPADLTTTRVANQPGTVPVSATTAARATSGVPMPVDTTGVAAGTTPVLVRYAYDERQDPGTSIYKRTGGSVAQAARLCSNYPSADAAQRGFISRGGPSLDPGGMDPDGDGFVCGWDPRPLRQPNGL